MNIADVSKFEWENTLRVLADKTASLTEYRFFLDIAGTYENRNGGKPRVILIGTYFPDEIIRAMGIDFCYVFGGSYGATLRSDVNIPKDADDETRSLIGLLKDEKLNLNENDVILIPLCNDSMKKLKDFFRDTATVLCYEVPSDQEDPIQKKHFVYEIKRVTEELKKHFKRNLTCKKLKEQCLISQKAAQTFSELEELFQETGVLTPSAFLLIASGYHMCKSRTEWILHLERLIHELRDRGTTASNGYPEILLAGSPIYAPNYKVLFVIEELRLRIGRILHPDIEHIKVLQNASTASFSIAYLAERYLESDITPVFVRNPEVKNFVTGAISGGIEGVVFHILKGQTLYDYECRRIEQLTAEQKIPLNRIETVYNDGDVEQIRLRLEAFSEMLNAKK